MNRKPHLKVKLNGTDTPITQARKKNDGAPTVNVDDGLMAVALGEAAHKSIETGLPVELASLVPGPVLAEIRAERVKRRLACQPPKDN